MKSPYDFDVGDNICGEAISEEIFNTFVRNDGGSTRNTSPMICTPPDPTNTNTHNFENVLADNTRALQTATNAVRELTQSVESLITTMNSMNNFRGTGDTIKAHSKKLKRYKDYVIKFLNTTKEKKATRGTLRRNLVKLESRFLSLVLKDLVQSKRVVKRGTTYALVQNDD